MSRYGIKSPEDLENSWSWAQVYVMGEAAFHNNYMPPDDQDEKQATSADELFALGIINFKEVS